jgi:hypothetical protein
VPLSGEFCACDRQARRYRGLSRKGEANVHKEDRFKQHTRSVWRRSYEAYDRWSPQCRAAVAPAIDALVAELRACTNEAELHARYWEVGDWPADVLRRHPPCDAGPEALLQLEDAAFWLRLQELEQRK